MVKKALPLLAALSLLTYTASAVTGTVQNTLNTEIAGLPLVIIIGLLVFLTGIAVLIFLFRDKIPGIDSGKDDLRQEAEEQLEKTIKDIKNGLEDGKDIEDHDASEKIDRAEKAVEEGDYQEALDIMNSIKAELDGKPPQK